MPDAVAIVNRLVAAYNNKDFSTLESLLSANIDFTHFNRGFAFDKRAGILEIMRHFAYELAPDRKMEPADRVTIDGNLVVREAFYTGTALADIPNFAPQGHFSFKLCSVFRVNDSGVIVEWKDYG